MKPTLAAMIVALGVFCTAGIVAQQPGAAEQQQLEAADHPEPTAARADLLRRILRIGIGAIIALVMLSAALLLFEDRFLYYPSRKPVEGWKPAWLGVQEVVFRTRDGLKLHGWWHPGRGNADPPTGPVVLWCHGNAGNITHRADNLHALTDRGLGVLLFDYRGYGKSQGRPSEMGFYLDAQAAYDYLRRVRGIKPQQIIAFGRSLGAAVALHVALRRKVAGLVLEGAFDSVPAMARRKMPLFVLWPMMRNRFDAQGNIPRLSAPLLMIHGSRDRLIPIKYGRKVYEAAPEPKQFYAVEGAGHNDTYIVGGDAYFDAFCTFCRLHAGKGGE